MHVALCPTIVGQSEGEKGAQSMLQLLSLSHGNLHIISRSLLHLADIFSSLEVARVDFLGALDDEEFFVVKGSGWVGVAGVSTPR